MTDASSTDLQRELAQLRARVERIEQAFREQGLSLGAESFSASAMGSSVSAATAAATGATLGTTSNAASSSVTASPSIATSASTSAPASSRAPRISTDGSTLERRLGAQVFNRVGIVALLVGMAWFLKFSFENHWVGPAGRVIIGLLIGAGLIVWSERFRAQGQSVFSYSLKAVGTGVLYLALWAAFDLYHLIPSGVAFVAMAFVTAWNGYICWVQRSQLLAMYALIGAFMTPVLVSTGENHQIALFTYLLVVDIGAAMLVTRRPWGRLILAAFAGTAALLYAWSENYYTDTIFVQTAVYIAVFIALFALVPHRLAEPQPVEGEIDEFGSGSQSTRRRTRPNWDRLALALLPLANAGLGFLAFYGMLGNGGREWARPWVAAAFAAAYLGLLRYQPPNLDDARSRTLGALHLAIAITFLTLVIPLATDGPWIPMGWLVEGAALLWIAQRSGGTLLRVLGLGALLLGAIALLDMTEDVVGHVIFNARFAAYIVAVAAFAVVARFGTAASTPLPSRDPNVPRTFSVIDWRVIAAVSVVCVNIFTLVGVVLEIHTYWIQHGPSWMYEQLSYSLWFMVWGALLLAIGFWKRTAFIRWQALILLVVSIGKVFLFDMSELSQGYRIISFLGLGVLLLGISYAYQRDLLGLRQKPSATSSPTEDTI